MKPRNLLHTACNILLTALLTGSILGCVISTFAFTVDGGALLRLIGLFSLFAGLCCAFSGKVWVAMIPPLLLAGPQLWKLGLAAHTEAFIWKLSTAFEQVYRLGFVLWWTSDDHTGEAATAFFAALALVMIFCISLGLSRRRTWPALALSVPLLLMCAAFPESELNALFFFTALLCLGILCLSASVRRSRAGDTPSMTAISAAACAAALVLLFAVLPQDSYVPKGEGIAPDSLISSIIGWFSQHSGGGSGQSGAAMAQKMHLDQAGPREDDPTIVFTARSNYNGYMYLRGRSYEIYTGTTWEADPTLKSSLQIGNKHNSKLKTYDYSLSYADAMQGQRILFLPWHPLNRVLTGGLAQVSSVKPTYEFSFRAPKYTWDSVALQSQIAYTAGKLQDYMRDQDLDPDPYLSLPESTKTQATAILRQLEIRYDSNLLDIVKAVSLYVENRAPYSLNTPKMPNSETDFVFWFLNDSETGYCVHYASAAAVLLRSAGIPARYVEGYMYYSQAYTEQSVTQQRAHAWVEYYVPTLGWMILEVTPDDGLPERLPEVFTEPSTDPSTEPSTDPSTEPSTEPATDPTTEPTTQPGKPTVPEPSTRPTTPSTQPNKPTPGPGDDDTPPDLSWLWTLLKAAAWIAGIGAALTGQRTLRLALLLRRLHRGGPNAQALARWKHCCRLARLRKQDPPSHLRDLAIRAKFSQHTLTDEELRQFDVYRTASIDALRRQPLYKRLVYRFVLAIY